MKRPKATHCGESFSREAVSSSSTSGWIGASFRTVVSRFTWGVFLLITSHFKRLTGVLYAKTKGKGK